MIQHIRWGKVTKIVPTTAIPPFDIYRLYVKEDNDGIFPNNEEYPTLLYKSAFHGNEADGRRLITNSGCWTSPWVWGIFTYHHTTVKHGNYYYVLGEKQIYKLVEMLDLR